MHPSVSHLETLFATLAMWLDVRTLFQVIAVLHSVPSDCKYTIPGLKAGAGCAKLSTMTLPRILLALTLAGAAGLQAQEPKPELLWPGGAPGRLGPRLTISLR